MVLLTLTRVIILTAIGVKTVSGGLGHNQGDYIYEQPGRCCRTTARPELGRTGQCVDTSQLIDRCVNRDLEASVSVDCDHVDGNWCCYGQSPPGAERRLPTTVDRAVERPHGGPRSDTPDGAFPQRSWRNDAGNGDLRLRHPSTVRVWKTVYVVTVSVEDRTYCLIGLVGLAHKSVWSVWSASPTRRSRRSRPHVGLVGLAHKSVWSVWSVSPTRRSGRSGRSRPHVGLVGLVGLAHTSVWSVWSVCPPPSIRFRVRRVACSFQTAFRNSVLCSYSPLTSFTAFRSFVYFSGIPSITFVTSV
ncbi:hypothetical protein BV898_13287 [Hypsibius exemplaris]|uniref:Uncharacterized protein n=1 Tax=Hypsibius exemplaris TaxID=2072580 RepID=A0A1W0WB91_HYPEX|nr:hypothetical protein BV898_13287 [Hypsibius exemplaris]